MRRLLVVAVIALAFATAALRATVLVPIEFRQLVSSAAVIVHGHVVDASAGWTDGRRTIETEVIVRADEYLKGNLGARVSIRLPGGQIGRYRTVFVGAPQFAAGDEVVLFLKTREGGLPYIVGLSQGAYRVVADPRSGRRMVTSPIVMTTPGQAVQRVVRGDPARRPLTVDAFAGVVRAIMAGGGGQ